MRRAHQGLIAAVLLLGLAGCSDMLAGLRQDLNDQPDKGPTTGGSWTERGLLDEDQPPYAVGHSDLRATGGRGRVAGDSSWADQQSEDGSPAEAQAASYTGSGDPTAQMARKAYANGIRATKKDFVDESSNEGSLWASDGQTNYYFTKNKVRGVGDIISIVSDAEMVRDVGAEIARTLTSDERDKEVASAQDRINGGGDTKTADATSSSAAAPQRNPASGYGSQNTPTEPRTATAADIDVTKSMAFKVGDPLMAEIVERYPNGNYKVRGIKRIPYRENYRVVSFLGIVRASDIADDDTVPSGKLYEYRLEATR